MSYPQRHASRPEGTPYADWPLPDAVSLAAPGDAPVLPTPEPRSGDWYVTVDERVEGVIEAVVADWPKIDAAGLLFDGQITTASFDQAELQRTVDRLRGDARQLQRPLRIGDAFWVRGSERSSLDAWQDLRDITGQARAMAKMVASVVAVGAVYDADLAGTLALVEESGDVGEGSGAGVAAPPPPPGASTANPVL